MIVIDNYLLLYKCKLILYFLYIDTIFILINL